MTPREEVISGLEAAAMLSSADPEDLESKQQYEKAVAEAKEAGLSLAEIQRISADCATTMNVS